MPWTLVDLMMVPNGGLCSQKMNISTWEWGRARHIPRRALCCDLVLVLFRRLPGFSSMQLPAPKGRLLLVTELDSDETEVWISFSCSMVITHA